MIGHRVALAALTLCAISSGRAAAQGIEFTPYVGLYLPTAKVVDQFDASCSCQVSLKQKTGFVLGARLTYWLPGRVGLEAAFGYSGSGVTLGASGFGTVDTTAHVLVGSARVLLALTPASAQTRFVVGGGLGLVAHGGDAYTGTKGTTDIGATLMAGLRIKVAPRLAMSLEVEDYLFSAQFDDGAGASTNSKFQSDLALSIGLAIPLGGS